MARHFASLQAVAFTLALAVIAPMNAFAADPTPDPAEPCATTHPKVIVHDAASVQRIRAID